MHQYVFLTVTFFNPHLRICLTPLEREGEREREKERKTQRMIDSLPHAQGLTQD